jgi:hypothetical protein
MFLGLALGVLLLAGQAWAGCPEDPNDNGTCDTLHVDIWPGDETAGPPWPSFARVPIRVTNDIPNPNIDSAAGFIIPLCYTHTNPSKYCSLSSYWNNTLVYYPSPGLDRSIFRHMPDMETAEELNWLMLLPPAPCWDTRILDLDGTSHFWLSLVPTGSQDQRFPGGSRVLTATMTFKLEDTTTVCIDTCVWPPMGYLVFARSDAVSYRPRHLMPVCQHLEYSTLYFSDPVDDQTHNSEGHYLTDDFTVVDEEGTVEEISASFSGEGLENATVVLFKALRGDVAVGHVEYDIIDHCQAGGRVRVTALNDVGESTTDDFNVALANNPPGFNLLDTWRAIAGYTMGLDVSAGDPDDDPVAIEWEAFWYEPDSLQPPINPPSFDGGNPGLFSWAPTETETGTWICSFRATDACGAEVTHQIGIEVGMLYCGDCNSDEEINLADVVYLVADLFKGGPPPDPACKGDANCSGAREVGDVVLLINYLFKHGLASCFECCP